MRVIVTGGAGYIGSVTVARLLERGASVTVVDNLSRGHRAAVAQGADLVVADILDEVALDAIFREVRPQGVVHFAALSLVGDSMTAPLDYYRNNVSGSLNVLRAAVAGGAQTFVLSSTAAVYGIPRETPISEDAPVRPINPYGATKAAVEEALRWASKAHDLRTVALRYFNAAGATEEFGEDHAPETHLIPNALRAAAGFGPALTVFGDDYPTPDGTCVRDYIHVLDLADAHVAAFEHPLRGAYNVGTGAGQSIRALLAAIERVTGRAVPHRIGARRPGDPPTLVASPRRLQEAIGFEARHSGLDEIIQSAWSWMQRHPQGYGEE